ncbi:MAG: hypothetical protein K2N17_05095 [Clostridia bacterium]|nr:hypothetical protein [Clostridia bacterium]
MKIKRKTFVGGILATLCACTALTFGAVFTSSATTGAEACTATGTINETTYTWTFMGQSNIGNFNGSRTLGSFNQGASESFGTVSFANGVATATKEQSTNSVAAYVSFKAEIVVPANTQYKVTYSYNQDLDRTSDTQSPDAQLSNFLYYYGNSANGGSDKSASETFPCSTTSNGDTTTGSPYFVSALRSRLVEAPTCSGELSAITYNNTTGSDKTYTAYFGFYTVSQYSGGALVGGTYTLTMSEEVEATVAVNVDKKSADYNKH